MFEETCLFSFYSTQTIKTYLIQFFLNVLFHFFLLVKKRKKKLDELQSQISYCIYRVNYFYQRDLTERVFETVNDCSKKLEY